MKIESRVGAEIPQLSNTANMILSVAQTIATISDYTTPEPGDLIGFGTSPGVGHDKEPDPSWLVPGEVCVPPGRASRAACKGPGRSSRLAGPHTAGVRGGLTAFNNILQTGLVDDGLLWPEAAATFKIAEVAPYVLRADLALVLGMVILPSAMLMIDSFTAGQSVCDMFQEGVIPGMLLAVAYVIAIWFMACFLRGFVGGRIVDDSEWMSPREIASKTLPTLGLITIVCSICMISRARPG